MTSALRALNDEKTPHHPSSGDSRVIEPRSGKVIRHAQRQTFHFSISFSGRVLS